MPEYHGGIEMNAFDGAIGQGAEREPGVDVRRVDSPLIVGVGALGVGVRRARAQPP